MKKIQQMMKWRQKMNKKLLVSLLVLSMSSFTVMAKKFGVETRLEIQANTVSHAGVRTLSSAVASRARSFTFGSRNGFSATASNGFISSRALVHRSQHQLNDQRVVHFGDEQNHNVSVLADDLQIENGRLSPMAAVFPHHSVPVLRPDSGLSLGSVEEGSDDEEVKGQKGSVIEIGR
jgi:hypothetical protein